METLSLFLWRGYPAKLTENVAVLSLIVIYDLVSLRLDFLFHPFPFYLHPPLPKVNRGLTRVADHVNEGRAGHYLNRTSRRPEVRESADTIDTKAAI